MNAEGVCTRKEPSNPRASDTSEIKEMDYITHKQRIKGPGYCFNTVISQNNIMINNNAFACFFGQAPLPSNPSTYPHWPS